ncbi:hypothetical protein FS842_007463 [Serendipita sp. 407]|nr:hypothetical protein FS842_007463 [Serendipita sp. 407]
MIDSTILKEAPYTHCYCEENVYLLGRLLLESATIDETECEVFVAFISNETKSVLLCRAKDSTQEHLIPGYSPVIWDYHVILILRSTQKGCFVYDFDSRMPLGCSFEDYFKATFPFGDGINQRYQR